MGVFKKAIDKMVSDKTARKTRKRMIVFVAIITMLSMVTSTVAWFSVNTFAGVRSLDVHISVSAQLKVSMEDHGKNLDQYVKTITNDMIDGYLQQKYQTKLADLILDPVTTTNGTTFTNQRGATRTPNSKSYLEFECYFIATEDMWVELTTEHSDIQGDEGTKVTSTSPAPKSDVVRCTRVGFTTESNGTAVYEPNKGTQINSLSTFDLPSGTMVYSDSTRLFHLDEMTPKKVTIRLWIDGEDPECDDDVQEADLTVALSFVGCDENNVIDWRPPNEKSKKNTKCYCRHFGYFGAFDINISCSDVIIISSLADFLKSEAQFKTTKTFHNKTQKDGKNVNATATLYTKSTGGSYPDEQQVETIVHVSSAANYVFNDVMIIIEKFIY